MGNNVFKKFRDFLSETKVSSEEKALIKKIGDGFKNNEFKMYLQFIVDNKEKKITSAEALSRWEPKDGEVVPPVKYIGVMEKYGLISTLDYYMFEMAAKKLCNWKDTAFNEITISCNFTRLTISENDFVDKIKKIADKYDFDRSKLLIEITEDTIEKNRKLAKENILKAKELGFPIALDDVGTGYTSLISLCEYPVDIVKLDRDVLLLTNKEKGRKLFTGIISLAHLLNLKVVCEGVETEEQNTFVSDSMCDYIQGWYYSKAVPELTFENSALKYMNECAV